MEALRDFSFYDTDGMKVSVCAIVGKNGSGKSSTVDLLIRTINNLSAVLLGEKFNFAAAEHLHFIDHVYAELASRIGNAIYVLEERGRRIALRKYMRSRASGYRFMKVQEEELLSEPTTRHNDETSEETQERTCDIEIVVLYIGLQLFPLWLQLQGLFQGGYTCRETAETIQEKRGVEDRRVGGRPLVAERHFPQE